VYSFEHPLSQSERFREAVVIGTSALFAVSLMLGVQEYRSEHTELAAYNSDQAGNCPIPSSQSVKDVSQLLEEPPRLFTIEDVLIDPLEREETVAAEYGLHLVSQDLRERANSLHIDELTATESLTLEEVILLSQDMGAAHGLIVSVPEEDNAELGYKALHIESLNAETKKALRVTLGGFITTLAHKPVELVQYYGVTDVKLVMPTVDNAAAYFTPETPQAVYLGPYSWNDTIIHELAHAKDFRRCEGKIGADSLFVKDTPREHYIGLEAYHSALTQSPEKQNDTSDPRSWINIAQNAKNEFASPYGSTNPAEDIASVSARLLQSCQLQIAYVNRLGESAVLSNKLLLEAARMYQEKPGLAQHLIRNNNKCPT